jgi:hypothetical protein
VRQIATRDSKQPTGPQLRFAGQDWRRFTDGVKAGRFDL